MYHTVLQSTHYMQYEMQSHSVLMFRVGGGGGGVIPYMSYIGMCRTLGYGFRAVLV